MNKIQLRKKIARLEFIHDQLEAEFNYIDSLLRQIGFPDGWFSAKEVAKELSKEGKFPLNDS